MKKHQAGFAVLTLAALICRTGLAEDTVQNTNSIPKVVVTAPPVIKENNLTPLAGQVSTVSSDQISALNAQDLPSALRRTPGVIISRHNPIGSFGGGDGGGVFIRGMGASRPGAEIQMAMDGIPRFVGIWTHPLMDTLSVDNAAQLNVYKGAQPVLFGNMSFGVVDMTTKRRTEPGFGTDVQLAGGSFNTLIETLEHSGKEGSVDYLFSQSFRSSYGHRDHSAGELQNILARIGVELGDNWYASLLYNRTDNWAEDPGDQRTGINEGRFDTATDFGVITLSNLFERAAGSIKVYWDHGAIDWVDQYDGVGANDADTLTRWDNYGIKARESFFLWEGGELLTGLDIDTISGNVDFIDPPAAPLEFDRETFQLIQPYTMLRQRIDLQEGIWMEPSVGARGFFHDTFDNEIGPQAGLVLNIHDTRLHAGYARGINYPGVFVETLATVFQPGNNLQDRLTAEKVDHFELGVRQQITDTLRVEVTGFVDQGKDRISIVLPPPPPPTWENTGDFNTHGVEATLSWSPQESLSLFAGGTWMEADPGDLPYTPEWSASAGFTWRVLDHVTFSMDASFVDSQTVLSRNRTSGVVNAEDVGAYFLLGGRIGYEFPVPWEGTGELFVAGENLTDTDYEHKPGYPMPGINGMSGVKLSF